MRAQAMIRLMMERQALVSPFLSETYEDLFRQFSPVHTRFWIRPGMPPAIQHRFTFDTEAYNRGLRRDRIIIKGRFQSGRIGYVFTDELPIFIAAYGQQLQEKTLTDEMVLRVLQDEGPMSIKMMAEICETPSKYIAASLKKLQQAFIVFEDQVDDEWDRAWYLLSDELGIDESPEYTKEEAQKILLHRFFKAHVFVTPEMVRNFTGFKVAEVKALMNAGLEAGEYQPAEKMEESGYILSEDIEALENTADEAPDTLFIMDNNDFLVRAHTKSLKKAFIEKPYKNLYYVLYRGQFIGAVQGRFTFTFDELEDVQLKSEYAEDKALKKRIIEALYTMYDKETSPLQRYAGKPL